MHTRRQVVRAAAAGTAGVIGLAGTAAADHPDAQPAHVTISYDQQTLEQYRPVLEMEPADRDLFQSLYGWTATSPEYDTDVHVYWARYSGQRGVTSFDSHFGDHEPVAVETDSDTGDVERVRASVYHWSKGETTAASAPLDGTNPRLVVIHPWHHYSAAPPDANTQAFDVADLRDEWDSWLDNGLERDVVPGASRNPWVMRQRGHWWRRGSLGFSSKAARVGVRHRIASLVAPERIGSL